MQKKYHFSVGLYVYTFIRSYVGLSIRSTVFDTCLFYAHIFCFRILGSFVLPLMPIPFVLLCFCRLFFEYTSVTNIIFVYIVFYSPFLLGNELVHSICVSSVFQLTILQVKFGYKIINSAWLFLIAMIAIKYYYRYCFSVFFRSLNFSQNYRKRILSIIHNNSIGCMWRCSITLFHFTNDSSFLFVSFDFT